MDRIIKAVSESTCVSVDDIRSRKRDERTCEARQIFIYLSRKIDKRPAFLICSYLNRSHQLISHSIRKVKSDMKIYSGFYKMVHDIEKRIISH